MRRFFTRPIDEWVFVSSRTLHTISPTLLALAVPRSALRPDALMLEALLAVRSTYLAAPSRKMPEPEVDSAVTRLVLML